MKDSIRKLIYSSLVFVLGCVAFLSFNNVYAEDNTEEEDVATSISISPVSRVLELEADSIYEDYFKITNNGKKALTFEAYASPYSYTYSDADEEYRLGFNKENTYTQITRWITFKDADGNYVKNPKYKAEGGETIEIHYRVTTPASIPAGGQYAVLFAHTLSDSEDVSGIKTEASPGMVLYGRANGETITTAEISDLELSQTVKVGSEEKTMINASAKIKNTGNVDFMAYGTLKVTGIFGRTYYETKGNQGKLSIIPESELVLSDKWEDTPYFGLFNATWTVSTSEEEPQTITKTILILPAPIIILMILLLTIVIIWIIILIRKRKERRSRFMV